MTLHRNRAAACLLLAGITLLPALALAGWEWQSPLPQGNDLYGIWGSGPDDVFAVGDGGTIIHYDGNDWSVMENGIAYRGAVRHLQAVWGIAPDDVYAAGGWSSALGEFADAGMAAIFHYDGQRWSRAPGARRYDETEVGPILGIWCAGPDRVFAVGRRDVVRYDGQAWTATRLTETDYLRGVWGSAPDDAFVVGSGGGIWHWDGIAWNIVTGAPPARLHAVWGASAGDVYAVGQDQSYAQAAMLHFDGTTWQAVDFPGGFSSLEAVWGSASNDVYAVGASQSVLHFDGSTWQMIETPAHSYLAGVWCPPSGEVFAAGEDGSLPRFDGQSWSELRRSIVSPVWDVWGASPADVWAVGYESTADDLSVIHHYDGSAWSTLETWPGIRLESIWGLSAQDIFAVGWPGAILHFDGISWSPMESGTQEGLEQVGGTGPQDVYASSQYGNTFHFDGVSWQRVESWPDHGCLWASAPDDIFLGAYRHLYRGDGATWTGVDIGWDWVTDELWGSPTGEVFAEGSVTGEDGGWMIHFDGQQWRRSSHCDLGYSALGGSSSTHVLASADDAIVQFDGLGWTRPWIGPRWLTGVWSCSETDSFAAGWPDVVLHDDGRLPLGVRISAPEYAYGGAPFAVRGYLDNPGPPLSDVPVFFVLELYSQGYYFWDDWTWCPAGSAGPVDYRLMDVPTGTTVIEVVPSFVLPAQGLPGYDLRFWGAMLDPTMTQIVGRLARVNVRTSWGPPFEFPPGQGR